MIVVWLMSDNIDVKIPGLNRYFIPTHLLNINPGRRRWKDKRNEEGKEKQLLSRYNILMKRKAYVRECKFFSVVLSKSWFF